MYIVLSLDLRKVSLLVVVYTGRAFVLLKHRYARVGEEAESSKHLAARHTKIPRSGCSLMREYSPGISAVFS